MKYAYLQMVKGGTNNNKFYEMRQVDDENFSVSYGRNMSIPQQKTYPMHRWHSIYNNKIKKGYTDLTDSHRPNKRNSSYKNELDVDVQNLITSLNSYSSILVSDNYNVTSITEELLAKAQHVIDYLKRNYDKIEVKVINTQLEHLFSLIPRKMKYVSDFLVHEYFTNPEILGLLNKEQALLDSLSITSTKDNLADIDTTFTDTFGLTIHPITDYLLPDYLTAIPFTKINQAYRVTHKVTKDLLQNYVSNRDNKEIQYRFHGSRNSNWLSILSKGLVIRPSGVIHNGSYLGDAIYGAASWDKSKNYTSLKGAGWTNGDDTEGIIGLFAFHTGNVKIVNNHSWGSNHNLSYEMLQREGYDSIHAKASGSLRNDEYTVYSPRQVTLEYLFKFGE